MLFYRIEKLFGSNIIGPVRINLIVVSGTLEKEFAQASKFLAMYRLFNYVEIKFHKLTYNKQYLLRNRYSRIY